MCVPKTYNIGNYKKYSWVQTAASLCYNQAKKVPEELISGLRDEKWIKKHFKTDSWTS